MYRFRVCTKLAARDPRKTLNFLSSLQFLRSKHSLPFATVGVDTLSGSQPAEVQNLVQGNWTKSSNWNTLVDPLNGEPFIKVSEIDEGGVQPFVDSLSKCPKHGLHNPFKAPERYLLYGDITTKAAHMLSLPEVSDFFTRLIQRVVPKSYQQAHGEVYVTRKFLENFCGDQVRFLARSFAVPGNHLGQQSHGFRWPYGPVAIITPFNFPLEIPVLQLMGALYMGNKPVLKVDSKVCIVMEQMLRLLHKCGLPMEDVDFINSDGKTMNKLLLEGKPRMTLFTGSSRVAELLAVDLKGRIKLEDAGFDWKILGPDVQEVDYVAWVCDQDAYACSGQKCSAQSMLFMHENWSGTSFVKQLDTLAARRKLEDLTIGPVLTVTTETMLGHLHKLLQVPEIFGPFQMITEYKDNQLSMVLDALERMHGHLTAVVISNDPLFMHKVIGNTVNGTNYAGMRARTTGAPQNHWYPDQEGLSKQDAVRAKLGKFGLPSHNHLTPIPKLSGEQKSIDALADALDELIGGVVLVSHDSRLISRVCDDGERSEIWDSKAEIVDTWCAFESLIKLNILVLEGASDYISMILAAFLDERGVTFDLEDKVVLWERGIVMDWPKSEAGPTRAPRGIRTCRLKEGEMKELGHREYLFAKIS